MSDGAELIAGETKITSTFTEHPHLNELEWLEPKLLVRFHENAWQGRIAEATLSRP